MLSSALALARNGMFVFPCRVRDKRPATANGCTDATRDPGEASCGRRPGVAVAMPLRGQGHAVSEFTQCADRAGQRSATARSLRLRPNAASAVAHSVAKFG